jgi:hypothetical protein
MGACTSVSAIQLLAMAFTFLLAALSLDLFWVGIPEEIHDGNVPGSMPWSPLARWAQPFSYCSGSALARTALGELGGRPQRAADPGAAIGVWRKMASRPAIRSDAAMPPTHAVHPNISKIN